DAINLLFETEEERQARENTIVIDDDVDEDSSIEDDSNTHENANGDIHQDNMYQNDNIHQNDIRHDNMNNMNGNLDEGIYETNSDHKH
ncbi:hypothetical protein ABG067_008416, partial [Albugo candida]